MDSFTPLKTLARSSSPPNLEAAAAIRENHQKEDTVVNTTIKYIVYTHTGGGVRHHHFGIQNNIIAQADGHAVAGDVINALGFPTQVFNGSNLPFAFMSVHGAADGNHLYTSPGNQTVAVGTVNIDILVVYAPAGGLGGDGSGGPGVWVDAFNVDTGNFSDSDFIRVLTPPTPPATLDGPKTSWANMDGSVSSAAAENLEAFTVVDGISFVEWKRIPSETYVATPLIPLPQGHTGEIWFAFYQSTKHGGRPEITGRIIQSIKHLREIVDLTLTPRWVIDDWCGTPPPHRIGPKGPNFQLSIPADIIESLRPADRDKLRGYIKAYPALANEGYGGLKKAFGLLKDVSDLLSQIKYK
jgi:hypothetical protein